MPIKIYTLTEGIKNRVIGVRFALRKIDNPTLKCHHCGIELKIGEKVVSRRSGNMTVAVYHLDCGKRLNII